MIISTREEETAADCQGLIGDLVIFSSVLSEQEGDACLCAGALMGKCGGDGKT